MATSPWSVIMNLTKFITTREKQKQIKWAMDYIEWQTYGQSKWMWDNWVILGGDDMVMLAPKRPTYEKLVKILSMLTRKGILVRDPHHWNEHCYFHRARKEPMWKTFWDEKRGG